MSDGLLLLAAGDEVAVATRALTAGEVIPLPTGEPLTVRSSVPRGHKVAVVARSAGEPVRKYGATIGRATAAIGVGEHVHVHNLEITEADQPHEFGTDRHTLTPPPGDRPTFLGYPRADGRVGTRNYIGILTSVNCSASTARMIVDQFRGQVLDAYPNVDGVVALTHRSGCGLVTESEGARVLMRTLRGYAAHPNIAGLLVLGLGCEMLQSSRIVDSADIPSSTLIEQLVIQDEGGIRRTVRAGVEAVNRMLEPINALQREPCDVSKLVLGLNCGGSDGYSGITANPALGVASDRLVSYGGTSILAETPEVHGAEGLLTRRAVSEAVGRKLLDRLDWWRDYTAAGGGTMDNNPSPGNKAGGLTTILEKSLGAVAKGGHADLAEVVEYAERPRVPGLIFMDTPGYDPVSVTGIVAGGANVVCFTTGRGSVFGCKPVPSIKLGTSTELYERMPEDIDINCGTIVDGTDTLEEVGDTVFEQILAVASGRQTVSEELDLGQEEFVPWQLGAVT
ncbi:D-galactarate dehydratase [Flexivirga endophytica]|uniref:D-galactarate dehydratase n=1 Tax=Flexivirga endophytica TaxID=1849103 RepID=A0A916TM47_9MICO|nr:altronate dehydratase family protein [Flexivirga endophytica]GGB48246.1 D-galactarate dehydratase [Flexivirga endophytica]GHB61175.1 D-galactarate dehydratase [Flexivirga endophytica]